MDFRRQFIRFALDCNVLRFGQFKTKAGRLSPYFFNAGLFNDGASLGRLAEYYAEAALAATVPFDMLFGPAYKGIPLAAAVAIALISIISKVSEPGASSSTTRVCGVNSASMPALLA